MSLNGGGGGQSVVSPVTPTITTTTETVPQPTDAAFVDTAAETIPQSGASEKAGSSAEPATTNGEGSSRLLSGDIRFPYQVKIHPIPEVIVFADFGRYVTTTFKLVAQRMYLLDKPRSIVLCFSTEKDRQNLIKVANGHVYKKLRLVAEPFDPADKGKLVQTNTNTTPQFVSKPEQILNDALPLIDIPYSEQNRLSMQDAELMALRLHGLLCRKNSELTGWAENATVANNGNLVRIEPLIVCPNPIGYRNKAKFRVGRTVEGEVSVGFGLNDHDSHVLGVEPQDRMLHLPDNMKLAAQLFQKWLVQNKHEPYDKRKKTGTFEYLLVRVTPQGSLMLVVIMSQANVSLETLTAIKLGLVDYFTNGNGAQCNVSSLYLQFLQDATPIYPREKLELLAGSADYEEIICGLKFCVSPFSILNISPLSSENIYNSVIGLIQPTKETVIIDACAGSCGIAFTLSSLVAKAYAIDPLEDNVRDAAKTRDLNNITNVEIIQGKCEDHLEQIFSKEAGKPIVVVIDPPRQGLPAKIMAQIRANADVDKVLYVCTNTKTGIKNFLDLASKPGNDKDNKLQFTGLPILPTVCIPIDCAPYTVNTTVPFLLERVNPSAYPAATKPPPDIILAEPRIMKRAAVNKKRPRPKRVPRPNKTKTAMPHGMNVMLRGVRGGGVQAQRSVYRQPPPPQRLHRAPDFHPPPFRGTMHNYDNMIDKYERRIAELEKTEQAFKAGLQAGLLASRGGGGMNQMDHSMGADFQSPSSPWYRPVSPQQPFVGGGMEFNAAPNRGNQRKSGGGGRGRGRGRGTGAGPSAGYGSQSSLSGYGRDAGSYGYSNQPSAYGAFGGSSSFGNYSSYGFGQDAGTPPPPPPGSRFAPFPTRTNQGAQPRGMRGRTRNRRQ